VGNWASIYKCWSTYCGKMQIDHARARCLGTEPWVGYRFGGSDPETFDGQLQRLSDCGMRAIRSQKHLWNVQRLGRSYRSGPVAASR
jgi:hypothetical protein